MAKHSKRPILIIVLTLCAALCFGLFAACTNPKPTDTSIAYTVTVMKDATEAASGVKVKVTKGGATLGEAKTTDENGKVEFSLAPDSYTVELENIPEHYELPESANLTMTAESHDLTITLAKKNSYEIKLVNPDGTPYTGSVGVILCTVGTDGNCLPPVTPVNGVANKEAPKGNYHVKIDELPAGYTYEQDEHGYYTGAGKDLTATNLSVTIKICPVTTVDLSATPMTAEEITAFKTAAGTNANALTTQFEAHKFTESSVAAGSAVYYTITPTASGRYYVYKNDTLNYYFDGTSFSAEPIATHLFSQYMTLEAGNTYYFKAVNIGEAAADLEFVLTVPVSSYIEYDGVGGNVELTIGKANTYATLAFKPTQAGVYTVTAQGTTPAIVALAENDPNGAAYFETAPADSAYTAGSSVEINYSPKNLASNSKVYLTVAAKAATYPATITVKIEKTTASNDTYTFATVESTLTQYTDAEEGEVLYGVPFAPDELVYNAATDTYTYDGKTVVVKITEPNDEERFAADMALAYLDGGRNYFPVAYEISKANANGGVDVISYFNFLRGFETYANGFAGSKVVPEDLDEENCYANFVNADGVYPLNKELKDFLEAFYAANEDLFYYSISLDAEAGTEWMFPLYYYDEEAEEEIEADAICGDYVSLLGIIETEPEEEGADPIITDLGAYVLTVKANGTFVIVKAGNEEATETGVWSKNIDTDVYTFTCTDSWGDGNTLTYNADTGVFSFYFYMQEMVELRGEDDAMETIKFLPAHIANYTSADETFSLSVYDDGSFTLYPDEGDSLEGNWQIVGDHFEFAVTDGVTYTVTRNDETGALIFWNDLDVAYVFVYTEFTLTTTDETATLRMSSNGTFELEIGGEIIVEGLSSMEGAVFYGTAYHGDALFMQSSFDDDGSGSLTFIIYYENTDPQTIVFDLGN